MDHQKVTLAAVILITYHGTVVCVSDNGLRLRHFPIGLVPDGFRPLDCRLSGGAELSVNGTGGAVWFALERGEPKDRTVSLRRARRYLRAISNGHLDVQVEEASGWERFLLLTCEEYVLLQAVTSCAWVRQHGVLIGAGAASVGEAFQLNGLSEEALDLSKTFPVVNVDGRPGSIFVFRDGWKIEELRRFRPLVYYSAFGSDAYLELFCLAVASFERLHPNLAEYLIFTDADAVSLRARLAAPVAARLQIVARQSCDAIDFFLQRYLIADVPGIEEFGPVLYLDTDVMACSDATPLLVDLAFSDLIEAGAEVFSPMLTRESVGSHLMVDDGITPPWVFGFNSGSLGFSAVIRHREKFQAIVQTTLRYAEAQGRHRLGGWFDQAPANYIAAKLGGFGTTLMTRYLVQVLPTGREAGDKPALIHFWGTGTRKLETMRAHLAEIEASS